MVRFWMLLEPGQEYGPLKINMILKHTTENNIPDEEGIRRAKLNPQGVYQHYSKPYVYGTRDRYDVLGDITIPFDRPLEIRRGEAAEAALLPHREIDTVVGYSMGRGEALSLGEKYDVNTKTINTPAVATNAPGIAKNMNK